MARNVPRPTRLSHCGSRHSRLHLKSLIIHFSENCNFCSSFPKRSVSATWRSRRKQRGGRREPGTREPVSEGYVAAGPQETIACFSRYQVFSACVTPASAYTAFAFIAFGQDNHHFFGQDNHHLLTFFECSWTVELGEAARGQILFPVFRSFVEPVFCDDGAKRRLPPFRQDGQGTRRDPAIERYRFGTRRTAIILPS